jgi:hypothetical protein
MKLKNPLVLLFALNSMVLRVRVGAPLARTSTLNLLPLGVRSEWLNTHSIGNPGLKGRGNPLWLPYLRAIPSPYPSPGTEGRGDTGNLIPVSPYLGSPHVSVSHCPETRPESLRIREGGQS